MKTSKRDTRVILAAIDGWAREGTLTSTDASRLEGSLEVIGFDWQRLARYSFWFAVTCIAIAVGSVLADDVLVKLIERIFAAPAALRAAGLTVVAGALFWSGVRGQRARPERFYRNEALFFLGVLATAGSIGFLGEALDTGSGHYSLLLLLASLVYAVLGFLFPSTLVWTFALLSLGAWLGAETGYASGWGAYFLGMNYPLRFAVFGVALLGLANGLRHWRAGRAFAHSTRVVALLYTFVALWILSIFGNYDWDAWSHVRQYHLLSWALLFGAAAAAAIWYGLRHDDRVSLGFGMTFLCINLYTRFFEYFWNTMHKAVFFALLGASFWWLGSRAERTWHGGGGEPWWKVFGRGRPAPGGTA